MCGEQLPGLCHGMQGLIHAFIHSFSEHLVSTCVVLVLCARPVLWTRGSPALLESPASRLQSGHAEQLLPYVLAGMPGALHHSTTSEHGLCLGGRFFIMK